MRAQEVTGNWTRRGRVLPHSGATVPRKPQTQILGSQVRDEGWWQDARGGRESSLLLEKADGRPRQKRLQRAFGGALTPCPTGR